jgi:hypothetical protein
VIRGAVPSSDEIVAIAAALAAACARRSNAGAEVSPWVLAMRLPADFEFENCSTRF